MQITNIKKQWVIYIVELLKFRYDYTFESAAHSENISFFCLNL